jgi:hypothetical protein
MVAMAANSQPSAICSGINAKSLVQHRSLTVRDVVRSLHEQRHGMAIWHMTSAPRRLAGTPKNNDAMEKRVILLRRQQLTA